MKVTVKYKLLNEYNVYHNVIDIRMTGENYFKMMVLQYIDEYTGIVNEKYFFTHGRTIEIED
ncbi:hypothetical protein [Lactococcus petauri]|uniref:hypothetical protein n=1 Tax=Lactococcus petauri TaxID=1940789 RepID=UPI0021184755|nr:hypothetical protein [Lactococcus petauri]MCQ8276817.1 hypothetical protein [Lactococcus petauri]